MTDPETPEMEEGLYDIAVVGLAGRFPGARNIAELWENLRQGVESISFFDPATLLAAGTPRELLADPAFVPARGVLAEADRFDAALFGFSPREAQIMDPQQRVFLECAWEALGDAACDPDRFPGAIGVYAGVSQSSYFLSNLLSHPELLRAVSPLELRLGNDKDFLATLASYRLNLRGPSVTVATACSSSLVAVHFACQGLLNRECDLALAGGASVSFPQIQGYLYQTGSILSVDGHCRAFDAAASGSVGGDGVGIVVLKRLADALADRDRIHAVVKGSAINNDGAGKIGFTAPSVEGQAAVIAEAQSAAAIAPDTISYVEAHGSGTPMGDPVEIRALTRAFRAAADSSNAGDTGDTGRTGYCAVGSVKTNLGHLDAAAGIAGLIKTVLALEHRTLPPSLHFKTPNPAIPFAETPFYVPAAARPWESDGAPRRAGVNSFGIGGTNAHVVLEEAPEPEPSGPSRPWQLLVLSAASPAALDRATSDLTAHLAARPEASPADLADLAHTSRIGRKVLRHRRALVCRDREDALAALTARDPERLLTSDDPIAGRSVAFLLSGVGDHYPGMASGLYRSEEVFRRAVDRCAEILTPLLGTDLRPLFFTAEPDSTAAGRGGPDLRRMLQTRASTESGLDRTDLLQPAVFVVDYALAQLWESWGVRPRALLGYSLGEYVAACLSGVFSLPDALKIVAWRAQRIAELPAGAMLAVPLPEAEIADLLGGALSLAAVNAPDVAVVSGPPPAVDALAERLGERGVACRRLPTTHAFHSSMMEPLAAPFARFLSTIELKPPRVAYVTDVTGTWVTEQEATDPEHWARHLCQPVRFAAGLATLGEEPATCLLEVGPGHGLATLARQYRPPGGQGAEAVALPSLRPVYDPRPDSAFLLDTLAKLWLAGVEIDWAGFAAGERRNRVSLPAYPFERQRYWIEPKASGASPSLSAPSAAAPSVLPSPPAAGAPASGGEGSTHPRPPLRTPFVAPRSERETRIAALWQDLLRIDAVGVHDSFFELGGHSLLAPQVLLRLRQDFGVEVPLPRLLEQPTVALLARAVEELESSPAAPGSAGIAAFGAAPDWAAEVVLDPSIRPAGEPSGDLQNPAAVLLTGATGFLGAFLLRDLLEQTAARVFCLVRTASPEAGRAKVLANLAAHQLAIPEGAEERIVPVLGDLAARRWGLAEPAFQALSQEVEAVYHAGAWVNFTYPYAALKAANVEGTEEALRLAAAGRPKPFHFISSIAVFAPGSFVDGVGWEDAPLASPAGLFGGYPQSKWMAEKLVGLARERGLRVTIHRPGLIAGDSRTGIGNPKDLLWAFLKGSLQLGAAPDLPSRFDPVPVDFVSRAIVYLSRQRESLDHTFHYVHPEPLSWRQVFDFALTRGYPVRQLDPDAWVRLLVEELDRSPDNALFPFRSLFGGPAAAVPAAGGEPEVLPLAASPRFDLRHTLAGLAGSAVRFPPLDDEQLGIYFAHFVASGFLPPPPGLERAELLAQGAPPVA
ncbi:MAG TPA: thioester reductase domain-containing protein [Thermoanaerobaculia bacterium]|nr:thioester reductase domain-containing protein [Thermoanaerobaculia bacterium]